MKRYRYTCKLLSDVVLPAATATEGFQTPLDYLPGAKFLGIAAGKLYDEGNETATLDLFHNGKVRFGDAHPEIKGEATLRTPFSWFHNKGDGATEKPLYLHHKISSDDHKKLTAEGKQLKQVRKGYFAPEKNLFLSVEHDFAIRSAYNRDERRAKDSQMFGYFSLPAGTTWTFTVEDDTEQYGEQIKQALEGKKRVGRSRSAEYGLVEITFDKEEDVPAVGELPGGTTLIYAQSNLYFWDGFGRPSLRPSAQQLGFDEKAIIDWKKSQVRSRHYQTWNRKRHNRDADRMIIEKGSVLVVHHDEPLSGVTFASGIGGFRSEGFGQVLLNPDFLQTDNGYRLSDKLSKLDFDDWRKGDLKSEGDKKPQDDMVLSFLQRRRELEQQVFDLDKAINKFLAENQDVFKGITASQWGMVRAYAKHTTEWDQLKTLLFSDGKDQDQKKDAGIGALYRGQSEQKWRTKGRREKLKEFLLTKIPETHRIDCTLKLAAEMAKRTRTKETAQTTTA